MTILFFSGIAAMSKQYTEPAFKLVDGHGVLFSLHPRYQSAAKNWLKRNCEAFDTGNVSVMFDSGAFTAWKVREPAQTASQLAKVHERVARWCDSRFRECLFISLDVLPGAPNRDPTPEEVASAIKQSDRNHAELTRVLPGRILPVFHRGERLARLNEVQDINPDYVCLSPLVGTEEPLRIRWALRAEAHLKARNPNTTIHGLATTGTDIMRAVDWRASIAPPGSSTRGWRPFSSSMTVVCCASRSGTTARDATLTYRGRAVAGAGRAIGRRARVRPRPDARRCGGAAIVQLVDDGRTVATPLYPSRMTRRLPSVARRQGKGRDNRRPPPGALAQTLPCMTAQAVALRCPGAARGAGGRPHWAGSAPRPDGRKGRDCRRKRPSRSASCRPEDGMTVAVGERAE